MSSHKKNRKTAFSPFVNPFLIFAVFGMFFLAISLWLRIMIVQGKLFTKKEAVPTPTPIVRAEIEIIDDDIALGNVDASVTIIYFSDYYCPYCGAMEGTNESVIASLVRGGYWEEEDEAPIPKLKEEYIESGKVRLVYKDFPLGIDSFYVASAARCANEQGKFWEYHDLLFENQKESQGVFDRKNFIEFAVEIGLTIQDFTECFDSQKHLLTVKENKTLGSSLGVDATPAIFVNSIRIPGGANSYSTIKEYIEQELNSK